MSRRSLTRRQMLLGSGAGAAALALGLTACGDDDDPSADAGDDGSREDAAGEGDVTRGFRFTDDRGETVALDEVPERIVAWQAIVPALVDLGIEPVGVLAFNPIETNPAFIDADVDTDSLVPVSTEYGVVNLETLAELDVDLIVTYTLEGNDFLQGFTDAETERLAGELAPFVVLSGDADVEAGIEKMEELAAALGTDLGSDEIRADAEAFDEAVDRLEGVVEDKPGLTVVFGGPGTDLFFMAPTADYPELRFYRDLGLDIFSGDANRGVSWELVGDVSADLFLVDDRTTEDELDAAEQIPTWQSLPAVAADQVSPTWRFLLSYSRADYARTIERMLPALESADPAVV